jgi:hypothetical protein
MCEHVDTWPMAVGHIPHSWQQQAALYATICCRKNALAAASSKLLTIYQAMKYKPR